MHVFFPISRRRARRDREHERRREHVVQGQREASAHGRRHRGPGCQDDRRGVPSLGGHRPPRLVHQVLELPGEALGR